MRLSDTSEARMDFEELLSVAWSKQSAKVRAQADSAELQIEPRTREVMGKEGDLT